MCLEGCFLISAINSGHYHTRLVWWGVTFKPLWPLTTSKIQRTKTLSVNNKCWIFPDPDNICKPFGVTFLDWAEIMRDISSDSLLYVANLGFTSYIGFVCDMWRYFRKPTFFFVSDVDFSILVMWTLHYLWSMVSYCILLDLI